MQSEQRHRIGIIGPFGDPISQLIEDYPEDAQSTYLMVTNPMDAIGLVDSLLVLNQDYALTYLPALLESALPCKVILRRGETAERQFQAEESIALLGNSLQQAKSEVVELLAITKESADSCQLLTQRKIGQMKPLHRLSGERPTVALRRDDEVFNFSFPLGSGLQETRQAEKDVFNWVRLRRLANLIAGDPNDLDMEDMTAFSRGEDGVPAPPARSGTPTMVVVVPNGIGLGHVTRMMSISMELKRSKGFRVVFWCFSRAAAIVQAAGFEVVLRQTFSHINAHPPDWRWGGRVEFAKLLADVKPDIVSYDGGSFDRFLLNAMRTPGCGKSGVLWVRRGMMSPDTPESILNPEQFSDLVLEPGDLAVDADVGPTRNGKAEFQGFCENLFVPSVTLRPYLKDYSRSEARKRLGLKRWGRYCLMSLGGAFGNWDELLWNVTENAKRNGINLVWAQSPLAAPPVASDKKTLIRQIYPLGPYLSAFDGVISATGYNSFHELLIGYDKPVLLAPTNQDRIDDQIARARYADEQGWCDVLYPTRPEEQPATIARFMKAVKSKAKITTRPKEFLPQDEMVSRLMGLVDRYRN
ncbi:hypothetical protein [Cognatishimia activa]|uniref:hypothetical protein n=1 Tax=Cognatishimia activa TaxID=1715691 RepID=UPI0006F1B651|nr:hypothetical protein [Cognatishimia activa]CUJ17954.1 putative glycosyl transferase [Cognatishimia activa]